MVLSLFLDYQIGLWSNIFETFLLDNFSLQTHRVSFLSCYKQDLINVILVLPHFASLFINFLCWNYSKLFSWMVISVNMRIRQLFQKPLISIKNPQIKRKSEFFKKPFSFHFTLFHNIFKDQKTFLEFRNGLQARNFPCQIESRQFQWWNSIFLPIEFKVWMSILIHIRLLICQPKFFLIDRSCSYFSIVQFSNLTIRQKKIILKIQKLFK